MSDIKKNASNIITLVDEAMSYKTAKDKLLENLNTLEKEKTSKKITDQEYRALTTKILKGRTKKDWLNYYNHYLKGIFDSILKLSQKIQKETVPESITKEKTLAKTKSLEVDEQKIKAYIKKKQKTKEEIPIIEQPYIIYKANPYGTFANSLTRPLVDSFVKKYPTFFNNLFHNIRLSDMKILTRSYVGIIFFSTFLTFLIVLAGLIFLAPAATLPSTIIRSIILSVLASIGVFAGLYTYPASIVNSRKRKIKNDLPFVTLQMSAIAGSGANPTAIFDLLLTTEEYKGLAPEIKKIVNYINLFGYDLNTALRSVSATTPSKEFRELLTGIVSTTEAGGDLKIYLKDKADEALTSYNLERKKYVQTISTYSDIYTAILIVAPLLFITVLAIIQVIGGTIGGFNVRTLAILGTFIAVPIINLAFLLFLNLTQPTT